MLTRTHVPIHSKRFFVGTLSAVYRRTSRWVSLRKVAHLSPENSALPLQDAAVLGGLLTALGFHSLRAESFEAEKSGLLLLATAVILASGGVRLRGSPLAWAVGGVLVAGLVASLTALSPLMSLFGAPERSQGWLSLLTGAVLCAGVSRLSPAGVRLLWPLLCLLVVVLGLPLLAGRLDGTALPRLAAASAAGNINYLAAWLVLAPLLIALPLRDRLRGVTPAGWRVLGSAACACIVFGLVATNSRAALIGLGAAALTGFALWCALTARRRAAQIVLAGCAVLLLIAVLQAAPLLSAFAAQDTFRTRLWDAAVQLVGRMQEPLSRADGTPDALAALRPLAGYGYDSLEMLDSRYIQRFDDLNNQLRIDRMHNQTLDTLLMTGWAGLAVALALWQTALLTALRLSGLVQTRRDALALVGLQTACGLAAGVTISVVSGHAGMGVALGMVATTGGMGLWLLLRAARGVPPANASSLPAALLCALVAAFVIEQFSFTTLLTQPLVWLCIGLLWRGVDAHDSAPIPAQQAHRLVRAVGLAMLVMLVGSAAWAWVALLMSAFGLIGAVWAGWRHWRPAAGTVVLWIGFGLALAGWRGGMTAALTAIPLGAVVGLVSAGGGLALWAGVLLVMGGLRRLTWRGLLLMGGAVLLYSVSAGSAVLQRRANELAALPDPLALHTADSAFDAAAGLALWNTGAVLDATRLWRTNPAAQAAEAGSRLRDLRAQLRDRMPFYNNARYYSGLEK